MKGQPTVPPEAASLPQHHQDAEHKPGESASELQWCATVINLIDTLVSSPTVHFEHEGTRAELQAQVDAAKRALQQYIAG